MTLWLWGFGFPSLAPGHHISDDWVWGWDAMPDQKKWATEVKVQTLSSWASIQNASCPSQSHQPETQTPRHRKLGDTGRPDTGLHDTRDFAISMALWLETSKTSWDADGDAEVLVDFGTGLREFCDLEILMTLWLWWHCDFSWLCNRTLWLQFPDSCTRRATVMLGFGLECDVQVQALSSWGFLPECIKRRGMFLIPFDMMKLFHCVMENGGGVFKREESFQNKWFEVIQDQSQTAGIMKGGFRDVSWEFETETQGTILSYLQLFEMCFCSVHIGYASILENWKY